MNRVVFLSLGSNLGNSDEILRNAIVEIEDCLECNVVVSPIYTSEPWGFESENMFLNCCIRVETEIDAFDLLKTLQVIEKKFLREKSPNSVQYEDRTLDIDIIYFGDELINTESLVVPHPKMYDRNFVVLPLNDISPFWLDPDLKLTVGQLVVRCSDEHKILHYKKN